MNPGEVLLSVKVHIHQYTGLYILLYRRIKSAVYIRKVFGSEQTASKLFY